MVIYFQSLFFFWPLSRQNAQSQSCVKRIDLTSKRLYNEMASKCLFRVLTLEQSFGFSPTSQIYSAVHLCNFFRIRNGIHNARGVQFRKAFLKWWYLLARKFITTLTLNDDAYELPSQTMHRYTVHSSSKIHFIGDDARVVYVLYNKIQDYVHGAVTLEISRICL